MIDAAELTPAMIEAGRKALQRSGILENDIFKVYVDDEVIKSIYRAMMQAVPRENLQTK
jgi:hypothetical protein